MTESSANLAQEYFEKRQDRYYLFRSAELTSYCCSLIFTLGRLSYLLIPVKSKTPSSEDESQLGFKLVWPITNLLRQPLEETTAAKIQNATTRYISPLIWRQHTRHPSQKEASRSTVRGGTSTTCQPDTVIYPLAQLTPLFDNSVSTSQNHLPSSTNEWAIFHLLRLLPESRSWTLATPYLKLPESLVRLLIENTTMSLNENTLLNSASVIGKIIVAAPEAMSFYRARGLAGYIPTAFQQEAQSLLSTIEVQSYRNSTLCGSTLMRLLQWQRGVAHEAGGWTFHAKGWWVRGLTRSSQKISEALSNEITMTVIGSSNYGKRSYTLDLEMDVLIVSSDPSLKQRMHDEERRILAHGLPLKKQNVWAGGIVDGVLVSFLMWIIWAIGISI